MNSDRALFVFGKALAALIAFGVGFIGSSVVWALLVPEPELGDNLWKTLVGLVLSLLPLAVFVMVGLLTAALSLLFHPSIMFRAYWLVLGLFVLALGVAWIAVGTSIARYVVGPLAVLAALYILWTAFFGSREDVEDPPLI